MTATHLSPRPRATIASLMVALGLAGSGPWMEPRRVHPEYATGRALAM